MAISERLALLVTLDAKGAINSFNDLGKAADKNLGKADQRLDRMGSRFQKAGAGMLATAGLLGVGLYKAGQAAGDLEQAVGGTEAVFGKASDTIDDYAKKAAQAAGLSESAFRTATTSIGGQLKGLGFTQQQAADQAVDLTQKAADLAATYGGSTADAVAALGAAFRGEADPAERFNLFLSQTRVNAKAVELGLAASTGEVSAQAKAQAVLALITEQSADAQGQFAREADTAQGSMARFRAESDNLLAALGSAVAPVIGDVADGLGSMVEGFNNLSPAQQTAISKFALFSTAAIGAAGAVSFTVGKVIDARDNFSKLAGAMTKTEGGLSRLGAVTGGVAAGVGIFALAMFKAQQRADTLRAAAAELREQAESTGKSLEDVALKKLVDTFAESDTVAGNMETLGVSFKDLRGPLQGSKDDFDDWAAGLRNSAAGGAESEKAASNLISRVGVLRGELGEAEQVTGRTAEANEALGTATEGAVPGVEGVTDAVDEQKAALDLATEAADKFKEGLDKAFGDLTLEEAVDRRAEAFTDMASQFADAQENVKSAKGRLADLLATPKEDRGDDFTKQVADAQREVDEAVANTSRSLDGNTDAALRNRESIRGAVDDIGALIQLHRDEGDSLEELQGIREIEKVNLENQLTQMGFNREEIGRYIEAIDKIPLTRETVINVDTAAANLRVKELADSLKALDPDRQLGIDAAVIDRNLQRASVAQAQSRRAIGGPVTAGTGYSVNEYLGANRGHEWFAPANGTITPAGAASGANSYAFDVTINNPIPEPASDSISRLRSVGLQVSSRG